MLSLLLRTSSASPSCCRSSLLAFCVAEYVQVPLADLHQPSPAPCTWLGYIRQPSGCSAELPSMIALLLLRVGPGLERDQVLYLYLGTGM